MNPLSSDKKVSMRAFILGLRCLVVAKGGFLAQESARLIASVVLMAWAALGSGILFLLAMMSSLRGLGEMIMRGGPGITRPFSPGSHVDLGFALAGSLIFVGARALFSCRTPSWRARRMALERSRACLCGLFANRFATHILLPLIEMGQGLARAFRQVKGALDGSSRFLGFRSVLLVLAAPMVAAGMGAVAGVAAIPLFLAMVLSLIVEIKSDEGAWRSSSSSNGAAYAQKEREYLDRETSSSSSSKAKTPPPRL